MPKMINILWKVKNTNFPILRQRFWHSFKKKHFSR